MKNLFKGASLLWMRRQIKWSGILGILLLLSLSPFVLANSAAAAPEVKRLAGYTQYDTASEIARDGWQQSDYAVLAFGGNFPDALAAAPLAYRYNAPILLTEVQRLTAVTEQTLRSLGVKNVYIAGGTAVVSQNVVRQLQDMGINVTRLAGFDRYETAVEIAKQLGNVGEICVVSGNDYADALSVSSYCARMGIPIILVPGNSFPASVSAYLNTRTVEKTYIVGNTDQIPSAVAGRFPNAERITGTDKYARNIAVIKRFETHFNFANVFMATGNGYADALAGSASAAAKSSPIVLLDRMYQTNTADYLNTKRSSITRLTVLGGEAVMPSALIQQYSAALSGTSPGNNPGEPPSGNTVYTSSEIAGLLSPSLVYIEVFNAHGVPIRNGSGFVAESVGKIVTNYQLVRDGASARITTQDGRTYLASRLWAYDNQRDLVVLKAEAAGLQPAKLGNSDTIGTGDKIYVLGRPFSTGDMMTDGLISVRSRVIDGSSYIQVTAPVSADVAGGVLVNEQAEVIGIATIVEGNREVNAHFAVPVNLLKPLLTQDINISLAELPRRILDDSETRKKSDREFQDYLNTKYASMTINELTVNFNWRVNEQPGSAKVNIRGWIDPLHLGNWMQMISQNRRGEMMIYFAGITGEIILNYPGDSFMGTLLYENHHVVLPSTPFFPPNEVSWVGDRWFVSHPLVSFYDLYPGGKSEQRIVITD